MSLPGVDFLYSKLLKQYGVRMFESFSSEGRVLTLTNEKDERFELLEDDYCFESSTSVDVPKFMTIVSLFGEDGLKVVEKFIQDHRVRKTPLFKTINESE